MSEKRKNVNGFYNDNVIDKFLEAYKTAKEAVLNGSDLVVRISNKNSKMGRYI